MQTIPRRESFRRALRQSAKRGISVVEVLVAMGIIGLLMSLIFPAVQNSRAAARKLECQTRLRQIGIAIQNHESRRGYVPANTLHRAILRDMGNEPLRMQLSTIEGTNAAIQAQTQFPSFLCPNNSPKRPLWFDYLLNRQIRTDVMPLTPGVTLPGSVIRFPDIEDGLSQTAMMAEQLVGYEWWQLPSQEQAAACAQHPELCVWNVAGPIADLDVFARTCNDPQGRIGITPTGGIGQRFLPGDEVMYTHLVPPNAVSCHNLDPANPNASAGWRLPDGLDELSKYGYAASSSHAGGVNVLICDGSVHFVSNSIDLRTWRALGTKKGGDIVGDF